MINDSLYISTWGLALILIGIISFPTTNYLFCKFSDCGWGFSKTLGSLLLCYTIFVFSTLRIIPFSAFGIYIILFLFTLLNFYSLLKNKSVFFESVREKKKTIIFQEILFSVGFLFWSYVRAHQPDIEGLEKFMDYGFINSILRTKFLPPADMWFAGKPINYYWFGHFYTAVLTKLTSIPSAVTYNLMLATIMGLVLTGTFSLVTSLAKNIKLNASKLIYLSGLISALALTFGGNFHTPFYVLKEGWEKYWYPDATRFIGYNPDTNDKTIHEFPSYSFIVSDLHPHLLNLPFVLMFIALLFSYFILENDEKTKLSPRIPNARRDLNLNLFRPEIFEKLRLRISNLEFRILSLGFLLGIFLMTNTWDFGNYLLLSAVSIFVFKIISKKFTLDSLSQAVLTGISMVITAGVTAFPFLINFDSIAQGIGLVRARTPLWQLAILWGFPAILTFSFFLTIFRKKAKIKFPDLFVASLLLTSWILIALPEIIYVKDIYTASHHRANTMFKLTYQAFVMFYLSSGYVIVKILDAIKRLQVRFLASLFYSSLLASILVYPYFGIKSYYNKLKTYKGLDGEAWLSQKYPDIYKAISWFREDVNGQPTILEAPGDSYTEFNVISSYTGLPTVSGWFVHEWLWRGSPKFPQERVVDIQQIYTSPNIEVTKKLLKKYNVEYVIVGSFERQKFPGINSEKFTQIGKQVFTSPSIKIYKI